MGERTSVRLSTELADAVKASGQPLGELIRRGLTTGTADVAQPTAPTPASPSLAAIPAAEPSPGVVCMARPAGRGTRPATDFASSRSSRPARPLTGETYQRTMTAAQARAIASTAA